MIDPRIEDLLDESDNEYTLVVVAARRARQIVDYYAKLGVGLSGEEKPLPPLLDTVHGLKPLTVSLREIAEGKIGYERVAGTEESVK